MVLVKNGDSYDKSMVRSVIDQEKRIRLNLGSFKSILYRSAFHRASVAIIFPERVISQIISNAGHLCQ